MTLYSTISIRLLIGLSFLTLIEALCPLCATPAILPKRWDFRLQDGRTCRDVYLELGAISESNPQCAADKAMGEELCCGDDEPQPFDFPPTDAPAYTGPFGDEPDCPICGTREFPGIPGAFIVARYVGEFTCAQLYQRGLNGMTPFFMCGPLQDFAEPVCGCGDFNPKCKQDPTQCWGYTGPGAPVPSPVRSPTPAPQPYVAPTQFDRKSRPETGKYAKKLSSGSGGAAGRLRGGRELVKGSPTEPTALPELKLEFSSRPAADETIGELQ